jgi:hypothetical protein
VPSPGVDPAGAQLCHPLRTMRDSRTGNPAAYDDEKGVIVIITSRFIHGCKLSKADFLKGGRYVPNR